MGLDYVNRGEAIQASTINSLIDVAGGNQSMSPDLNVTTTARGPQVSLPSAYGGKNKPLVHYLDTSKYILSSWPYTSIALGPTLDSCLNTIRLHNADGTVSTPISAAVVYQNSDDSPTGSELTGYMLRAPDFGKDKSAHAAGWVHTKIEDRNGLVPAKAELWAWQKPAKMAAVFTNVSAQQDVQDILSSLLQEEGADGLSSLQKIGSWRLTSATALSVGSSKVPSHELVEHHGVIEAYDASQDQKTVLRAELMCYDAEYNDDELQSSKWAWKVWLGDGVQYDQSTSTAHSDAVTAGGNDVLFEADELDSIAQYTGQQVFMADSIIVGEVEVEAGDAVESELWLQLSNDNELVAVKGEFTTEPNAAGSYADDGLLQRKVFVAKTSGFTPTNGVQIEDYAPAECISCGTYGHQSEGYPLLDTYFGDNQLSTQSLDWTSRAGDASAQETVVAQLYKFDQMATTSPLSTDHVVVRRVAADEQGAAIDYVPLTALLSGYTPLQKEVDGDADTAAGQYSIQTLEDDGHEKVLQLYNFNDPSTTDVLLKDIKDYDIVVRNGNAVEYVTLSGANLSDIIPDAAVENGQKSIDWLESDEERVVQLYKFNEDGLSDMLQTDVVANGTAQSVLPEEYEFVVRKHGAGGEIDYAQVSLSVSCPELSTDTDAANGQKSVEFLTDDVLQLYDFDQDGSSVPKVTLTSADTALLPNGQQFVVRKKVNGKWQLDYAPISACISVDLSGLQADLSVDTDATASQKSIEWAGSGDQKYLQLYNMDAPDSETERVTISESGVAYNLCPDDYTFVMRSSQGGHIEYKDIQLCCTLSGMAEAQISGDTNAAANVGWLYKSVQTIRDDMTGQKMHQLYQFSSPNVLSTDVRVTFDDGNPPAYLAGNSSQLVARVPDGNGASVAYKNIIVSQEHERLDYNRPNSRGHSLDYVNYLDQTYGCYDVMELYGFDLGQVSEFSKSNVSSDAGDSILVRKSTGGSYYLEYMSFDSLSNFFEKYIGDSEKQNSSENSISTFWDNTAKANVIQLYDWHSEDSATVEVHTDGCEYFWPQDVTTDSSPTDMYYVLMKHVTNGTETLEYKQLQVQMPDIDLGGIWQDIGDIQNEIVYIEDDIEALSAEISSFGDNYWVKGSDEQDCYGSAIGNSSGSQVIDLDNKVLVCNNSHWYCNSFIVDSDLNIGSTYFTAAGYGYIADSLEIYGTLTTGCSGITIGTTSLSESQLQQLLRLIN